MASYHGILHRNIERTKDTEILNSDLELLLLDICKKSQADLYTHYYEEMPIELVQIYENGVDRLINNEPLQYITGYQPFYGYDIKVNENVLIPRVETEELVSNILIEYDTYFSNQQVTVADIGTGSGAIAIALCKEEGNIANMYATDISEKALEVAKENSDNYYCNINFLIGDMLQPLIDNDIKVDILISNPPYIPNNQEIQISVLNYEPHVALFGGDDGLDFYRKIFIDAHKVIKEKSFLAFEIGYDQKEAIIKEVEKYFPNDRYTVLKDINEKDRMLFIYHNL